MNPEIISISLQLDSLVQSKLNTFRSISEASFCTIAELKSEINNLRYLIYMINQDRIVKDIQTLRQALSCRHPFNFLHPPQELSQKLSSPDLFPPLAQYDLYDMTGNSSDICTVVNTSVLPVSSDPTEREFSPFSVSPLCSPRTLAKPNRASMVILTTEATFNKPKQPQETTYLENLQSDDYEVSPSNLSDLNSSVFTLNTSSYIPQPPGDEVASYSCLGSKLHSPTSPLSPS